MSSRNASRGSSRKTMPRINLARVKVEVWMKPGRLIWVEKMGPKNVEVVGYIPAIIKEAKKKEKKIVPEYEKGVTGPEEVYASQIMERSEEPQILEDLVDIDPLNDAELMKCLELRYREDEIYCFCGPTLISINPYKGIDKFQDPKWTRMFRNYALYGGKAITYPHIENIASRAFYQLFDLRKKQAICISGESGAGKSYGTRQCMKFLTGIFDEIDPPKKEGVVSVEEKINGCNPIIEAFGNAKTVMNNDSSRFGKYFELMVDKKDKHIKGARIKTYLLEKSRIVTQGDKERSYHIFYAIMKFMDVEKLTELLICERGQASVDMTKFNYINKSNCYNVIWDARNPERDNDLEFFQNVTQSLNSLGFSEIEQNSIWKTLSVVLNLGNVKLDLSSYEEGTSPCKLLNNKALQNVLQLLDIDFDLLSENLCTKVTGNGTIGTFVTILPPQKCESTIDALSKDLFNNLFGWLVRKLNLTILPDDPSNYDTVGLLDIFGFEDFTVNSLEQFCINYTNEELQNLYIFYVFEAEKVIFEEEGLKEYTKDMDHADNEKLLSVLNSRPFGIFQLIDSVTKMGENKSEEQNDAYLMSQIKGNLKGNECFKEDRLHPERFTICHTAKEVIYTINGFVEKNKDELPENLRMALSKVDKEIYKIFQQKLTHDEVVEEHVKDTNEKFLGYKFRTEMMSLMNELKSCDCNFIRCIKPNDLQKADFWAPELALKQIKYLGVLDSIKVRREAWPIRRTFMNFYEKYQDLDERSEERHTSFVKLRDRKGLNWKQLSENILKSIKIANEKEVLEGKTRIFMTIDFFNYLQELLEDKQKNKREAMKLLSESVKPYVFAIKWMEYRKMKVKIYNLSKNLLNTWNSKIEYVKFKKTLSFIKRLQMNTRMTRYKRRIRLQKFSANVIGRSYKIFKIRKMLYDAEKTMSSVAKCRNSVMFKLFMVKIRINKKIVNKIVEDAWAIIQSKFKLNSSRTIQRIWRGHFARMNRKEEVIRLRNIKEEYKDRKAAKTIQRYARGFLVRVRLDRMNRAAGFIQGHLRMKYLSYYFQRVRWAVRTISRIMKMYTAKNKIIKYKLNKFYNENKNFMEQLRSLEYAVLFKTLDNFFNLENLENFTRVKFFEGNVSFRQSIPDVETFIPSLPVIDLSPKMRMFSMVIDFDCQTDTSDSYAQSWSVDFLNFIQLTKANNSRLMCLEVGHSFSLAVSDELKIFNWGLNDSRQLAKGITSYGDHHSPCVSKTLMNLNPRVIASGDDHTIMIDYKNDVYMWGDNKKGQLGLGHPRKVKSVVKMTSMGKNLKTAVAKGKQTYVVTGDGNILKWPNKQYHCKFLPMMVKANDSWVKFQNISCGYDYAIALTTNGLLFSYGMNDNGQLGLGDLKEREIFTMVEKLKDLGEKTMEVSCGYKHVVCRTANGKVYSWGLGSCGQLGSGDRESRNEPEAMKFSEDIKVKTLKAVSAQAGFNSTYVLYEDHRIYTTGRSAARKNDILSLKLYSFQEKHTLNKPKSSMDFVPIKLFTSWSKSVSICYVIIGDFRSVDQKTRVRHEIVKHINKKWLVCNNQIMPPYDKSIAKHMSSTYIKKIQSLPKRSMTNVFTQDMKENYRRNLMRSRTPIKRKKKAKKTPVRKRVKRSRTPVRSNKSRTPVRRKKSVLKPTPVKSTPKMSSLKTPIRSKDAKQNPAGKRKRSYSRMSRDKRKATIEERRKKMKKLKAQLHKLMEIPQAEWTEEDRKLIDIVRNYEYLE